MVSPEDRSVIVNEGAEKKGFHVKKIEAVRKLEIPDCGLSSEDGRRKGSDGDGGEGARKVQRENYRLGEGHEIIPSRVRRQSQG